MSISVNTVRKYIAELEEQGLVVTEPTSVMTKDGRRRNGSLRYTILPIQNAVDLHNQRQLRRQEETTERMRVGKELESSKDPRMSNCEPSCAVLPPRAGQRPGGCSAPKYDGLRRTKEEQEKALALSVRQGGHFCPQCGQLRERELTLF